MATSKYLEMAVTQTRRPVPARRRVDAACGRGRRALDAIVSRSELRGASRALVGLSTASEVCVGRVEGVEAARRRVGAVTATTSWVERRD